ncbi:MAG: nuclear transport factor 2 family protein [bacterium]
MDKELKNTFSDDEEIIIVSKDYIEGWYEGNKERMKNALHPDMVKRRIKEDDLKELNTKQMIYGAERGGGKNVPKDTYEISVDILDKSDNIASVVTKSEYIDYLHLAKVQNKWKIINVLWDFNQ